MPDSTHAKGYFCFGRIRTRLRWWWGDRLCQIGRHKPEPVWEDACGTHGGDCLRCGLGPR